MSVCIDCGGVFQQAARGRRTPRCKPCGMAWRKSDNSRRSAERYAKRKVPTYCQVCNVELPRAASVCAEHRGKKRVHCLWCGTDAVIGAASKGFCSLSCAGKHDAMFRPRFDGKRSCPACERDFTVASNNPKQVCCSQSCASRWQMGIRVEILCPLNWRTCGRCGVEWLAKRQSRSNRCQPCAARDAAQSASRRYWAVGRTQGGFGARQLVCDTCKKTWVGNGRNGPAYCSRACYKRSPQYRANRKLHELRRERRLKSAEVERFTSEEIFERDGRRCQLCLRKLEMGKSVPHPMAPTIDHIIPLADGGPHTRANVQAAHFKCNSLRGNRGAAQLRLA